jgi:hypothetical protein
LLTAWIDNPKWNINVFDEDKEKDATNQVILQK